jgi:hypothetical protein
MLNNCCRVLIDALVTGLLLECVQSVQTNPANGGFQGDSQQVEEQQCSSYTVAF